MSKYSDPACAWWDSVQHQAEVHRLKAITGGLKPPSMADANEGDMGTGKGLRLEGENPRLPDGWLSGSQIYRKEQEAIGAARRPAWFTELEASEFFKRTLRIDPGGASRRSFGVDDSGTSDSAGAKDERRLIPDSKPMLHAASGVAVWTNGNGQIIARGMADKAEESLCSLAGARGGPQILERVHPAGSGSAGRGEGKLPAFSNILTNCEQRTLSSGNKVQFSLIDLTTDCGNESQSTVGFLEGDDERTRSSNGHTPGTEADWTCSQVNGFEPHTQSSSDDEESMGIFTDGTVIQPAYFTPESCRPGTTRRHRGLSGDSRIRHGNTFLTVGGPVESAMVCGTCDSDESSNDSHPSQRDGDETDGDEDSLPPWKLARFANARSSV